MGALMNAWGAVIDLFLLWGYIGVNRIWTKQMRNEATNSTGYGYSINSLEWVAPQVFAISNGLAWSTGFIRQNGQVGTMSDLGDAEFEWEGRILPTIADCEAEIAAIAGGKPAVSVA